MIIVDAGPLYAAADITDRHHHACREYLRNASRPLVVPALVLAEVAHLLSARLGPRAELALADDLRSGRLQVEPVLDSEWSRIHSLVLKYIDLPLGIADASLLVLAERYKADTVATLDRRHFSVVRPLHVAVLTLEPDLTGASYMPQ